MGCDFSHPLSYMHSIIGFGNTQQKNKGSYTNSTFRKWVELIDMGNSTLGPSLRNSLRASPLLWINPTPIYVHIPQQLASHFTIKIQKYNLHIHRLVIATHYIYIKHYLKWGLWWGCFIPHPLQLCVVLGAQYTNIHIQIYITMLKEIKL
jgi:hypothetical protein